jgi:hypothetical protein
MIWRMMVTTLHGCVDPEGRRTVRTTFFEGWGENDIAQSLILTLDGWLVLEERAAYTGEASYEGDQPLLKRRWRWRDWQRIMGRWSRGDRELWSRRLAFDEWIRINSWMNASIFPAE